MSTRNPFAIVADDRHDTAFELAFGRLRRIASGLLRRERGVQTLQSTSLVHEAYLKWRGNPFRPRNEAHFFATLVNLMKQILIDRSRRTKPASISLDLVAEGLVERSRLPVSVSSVACSIDVRRFFAKLREYDPVAAEALWLRSVEGLTIEEVAIRQKRMAWRVREDEEFALKWMRRKLHAHS